MKIPLFPFRRGTATGHRAGEGMLRKGRRRPWAQAFPCPRQRTARVRKLALFMVLPRKTRPAAFQCKAVGREKSCVDSKNNGGETSLSTAVTVRYHYFFSLGFILGKGRGSRFFQCGRAGAAVTGDPSKGKRAAEARARAFFAAGGVFSPFQAFFSLLRPCFRKVSQPFRLCFSASATRAPEAKAQCML